MVLESYEATNRVLSMALDYYETITWFLFVVSEFYEAIIWYLFMVLHLCIFIKHNSVKVAANKITSNDAYVEN